MQLTPGEVVAEKYHVESLLGDGGMGSVYIATNQVLRRRIALKVMNERFAGTKEASARFIKEAVALSRVTHPNIVQVFDAGEHRGQHWIAMELLEGETLSARLERGRMSVGETLRLAESILGALAEVHSEGIVHRDLKPDNIFMTRTRSGMVIPKLLDFGVAKNLHESEQSRLTTAGSVIGTMHYLAPEQAHGESSIDHRADIYAVGVVLFEALSGQTPYAADTLLELVLKMVTEPPRKLSDLASDVPPQLVSIIERCLASSPNQRFQSATDLLDALRAVSERSVAEPNALALGEAPTGYGPILAGTPHPAFSDVVSSAPALSQSSPAAGTPTPYPAGAQPPVNSIGPFAPNDRTGDLVASHPATGEPSHIIPPQRDLRPIAVLLAAFAFGALLVGGGAWYLLGGPPEGAEAIASPGEVAIPDGITAPQRTESANIEESAQGSEGATAEAAPDEERDPRDAEDAESDEAPAAALEGAARDDQPAAGDDQPETRDDQPAARESARAAHPSGRETPPSGVDPPPRARSRTRTSNPARSEPEPAEPENVLERRIVRPGPRQPVSGLHQSVIERAVNGQLDYLSRCEERLESRQGPIRGAITATWTVTASGRTANERIVENTTGNARLARCVVRVIRARYPVAQNRMPTSARMRFTFQ